MGTPESEEAAKHVSKALALLNGQDIPLDIRKGEFRFNELEADNLQQAGYTICQLTGESPWDILASRSAPQDSGSKRRTPLFTSSTRRYSFALDLSNPFLDVDNLTPQDTDKAVKNFDYGKGIGTPTVATPQEHLALALHLPELFQLVSGKKIKTSSGVLTFEPQEDGGFLIGYNPFNESDYDSSLPTDVLVMPVVIPFTSSHRMR